MCCGRFSRSPTGEYVTNSTSGFFPDKKSPAYTFCQLFQALHSVVSTDAAKKDKAAARKALTECQKSFEAAAYDMNDFVNRGKMTVTLRNDKGVTENRYNERLATLYDMAGDLSKKHKVDVVKSMIYTAMFNCAVAASILGAAPYMFTYEDQQRALKNGELAIKKALKVLK